MQTNLYLYQNKPSFGANVSKNFVKAAHNYYNGVEYRPYRSKVFDEKVKQVVKCFGYNEFTLKCHRTKTKGKTVYNLVADNGLYEVPIAAKDQFRKVIEKFMRLTRDELYIKIEDFRNAH